MSAKSYSLRRRLIATTVGSSVAVGLVSTVIVLVIAWKEVGDAYDDTLEEGSRIVLALGEAALRGPAGPSGADDRGRQELRLNYQMVAGDGTVLLRGNDAPKQPFVAPADLRGKSSRFHDVQQDDRWWRVHVRRHPTQDLSVQVGQKWKERSELIGDVLESLAWPLAALWAMLGGVNWWLIRRQLAPLERMAQGMEAKSPDDLSPVADASRAHEVHSVVGALNRLLERLSRALEGERRFTADAAHELRTPLAALASRIQLMQRSHAAQSPQLAADLQRLRDDVARSTSMVENLLQLARLDPQSSDAVDMRSIDLRALLDEAVHACAAAAAMRRVNVSVECHVDAVMGHREWLFSALRNLVDNAIRYGAEGGRVQVSADRRGAAVEVAVRDDGPGVSGESLALLTQRFYRVLGTGTQGSGLGLSIVARVAELHGAALRLGEGLDGRGLGVVLELRPARSDSLHVRAMQ
ncbi:ATP-binding protein [Variovorax sp. KK3]|uniref:ATP-binding protein n=1 Tax=Variovorax sp. KK3 TaxID=1855728 RepID=UPI00097C5CAE|nr:ATP-binding protein [Variovorax sp. KK3]